MIGMITTVTVVTVIKLISIVWFMTSIGDMLDRFWATLALTFNFPLACMVSLIAYLVDKHLLGGGIRL